MLASLSDAPLDDPNLTYEPKYDGIRALVEIIPQPRGTARVRLFSRLGNEKSAQFPEIVLALARFGAGLASAVILDGEIVALDEHGEPAGFQHLQGRMHQTTTSEADIATRPTAFIAFDLICDEKGELCGLPLLERRARLERLFERQPRTRSPIVRLSELATGSGRARMARATEHGWEGLIAKHAASRYRPGKRTPDWRKLKLVHRQEFVVAGWTEPRGSRSHFGALLLGYYDDGGLRYAGHAGSGFDEQQLTRVWQKIRPLEATRCPFAVTPTTNERPHWIAPALVAEVKFGDWTDEGMLRHPIHLGLREDVEPERVRREGSEGQRGKGVKRQRGQGVHVASGFSRTNTPAPSPASERMILELERIEAERGSGILLLPGDVRLSVTNLKKVFWPGSRITKGELLRYYVTVARWVRDELASIGVRGFPKTSGADRTSRARRWRARTAPARATTREPRRP